MKRKYVQAMMAGTAVMLSMAVPVTSVSAAVPEKEQTVYVNADQNGNTEKVIVSNWLKNTGKEASITDKSSLSDIKNVKGEEEFTQNSDGTITWAAGGEDIYYQGSTSEELPVAVKMTYFLDGKEIQPSQLAGKSGKVKIRIDYENKSSQTVKVNGKEEQISTPFMMATGMILPTEKFSNVDVTNGKVISDGQNEIVMGIGFPGLSDSLKLSEIEGMEDTEIPDYVEITADVTDFSLALTTTVATTGTLNELGMDDIDSLDDLKSSLDELTDASTALVEGSRELSDGIDQLNSSADEFVSGLNSADDGAGQLKAGIDMMNGQKGQLIDGVNQLAGGLQTLQGGSQALKEGVSSYTEGANQLFAGVSQVDEGAKALKAGIDTMNEKKTELAQGVKDLGAGTENLSQGTEEFASNLKTYTAGTQNLSNGLKELYSKMEQSLQIFAKLPETMKTLQSNVGQLAAGAGELANGAAEVQKGAADMQGQLERLKQGVKTAKTTVGGAADLVAQIQYSDTQALSQDATAQAREAAAGKLKQANDQQKANVASALEAAGVSEDQKAAVLANLEGISTDVSDIQVTVSDDTATNNAEVKAELARAQQGLEAISGELDKVQIDPSTLQPLTDGAAKARAGADQMQAELKKMGETMNGMRDIKTAVDAMLKGVKDLKDGSEVLCGNNEALNKGAENLNQGAKQLNEGVKALLKGTEALSDGIGQLAAGADSLTGGTAQLKAGGNALIANNFALNSGAGELADGSQALLAGGLQLQAGAGTLSDGISQLAAGAGSLKEGTGKLAAGGKTLKEGTTKLSDGGQELAEGMEKFDKEGIQELADVVNGDVQDVLDRLDAVVDADKSYTAFDGWDKDQDGSVKFLIETAGIE